MGQFKRILWWGVVCGIVGFLLLWGCARCGWRIYKVEQMARDSDGITKSVPERVAWSEPESLEGLQRVDLGFASFCIPKEEWYLVQAVPSTNVSSWCFNLAIRGTEFNVVLSRAGVAEEVFIKGLNRTISTGAKDMIAMQSTLPVSLWEVFFLPHEQFMRRLAWLKLKCVSCLPHEQYIFEGPDCRGYGGVAEGAFGRGVLELCGDQGPLSVTLLFNLSKRSALCPKSFAELVVGTFAWAEGASVKNQQVALAEFVERARKGEGDDARFIVLNNLAMPVFPLADALKVAREKLASELGDLPCVSAESVLFREGDGWLLEYGGTAEEQKAVLVSDESVQLIAGRSFRRKEGVPNYTMEQMAPLLQQTPDLFTTRLYWRCNNKWWTWRRVRGGFGGGEEKLTLPQEPSPAAP